MSELVKRQQDYVLAPQTAQACRALAQSRGEMEYYRAAAQAGQGAIRDIYSYGAWCVARTVGDMEALKRLVSEQGMSPLTTAALDALAQEYFQRAAELNEIACGRVLHIVAEEPDLEPTFWDRLFGH